MSRAFQAAGLFSGCNGTAPSLHVDNNKSAETQWSCVTCVVQDKCTAVFCYADLKNTARSLTGAEDSPLHVGSECELLIGSVRC